MKSHELEIRSIINDLGWDVCYAINCLRQYEDWSGESVHIDSMLKALKGETHGDLFSERLAAWFAAKKVSE